MAGSSQSLRFFWSKTLHWPGETGLTTPPFFPNARKGAKIILGVLDDSPLIVNWSGLDSMEQAEITPTLETTDNWIIFTADKANTPTPPIPKGAQRILTRKAKPAGREGGGGRERTNLPHTAWTPKCGLVRTARFPTQVSSILKHSSRRNRKKIFQICDLRGQNQSTGRARSQA